MVAKVEFTTPDDYGKTVCAPYACFPEQSRGRLHGEINNEGRSAFQRDYDKITHCDAFRRLHDKTQVFSHSARGDHSRSRASHTYEVAQITQSVARQLGLNHDLAGAIALAHDIGHPPFGHAGEVALQEAMKEYGGFDHNAHAIRIVTNLSRKDAGYKGLDLTWETREGIAKHNGPVAHPPRALAEYNNIDDLELNTFASGEAQVAALCDDIAYINHDIEDGIRSGLINIEQLMDIPLVGSVYAEIRHQQKGITDEDLIKVGKGRIIDIMVNNLVQNTQDRLQENNIQTVDDIRKLKEETVVFSPPMQRDLNTIKDFLMENMYQHPSVIKPLKDAQEKIGRLFGAFLDNPSSLPPEWAKKAGTPRSQQTAETVCDYIAGMTDQYAMDKFQEVIGGRSNGK